MSLGEKLFFPLSRLFELGIQKFNFPYLLPSDLENCITLAPKSPFLITYFFFFLSVLNEPPQELENSS